MVLDGLPEGVDDVYEWAHVDDTPDEDGAIELDAYLEPAETEQSELDDFYEEAETTDTTDYSGESRPRVVNTQFMGRRNYAREPGRTTDFDW
jgi:hypothetical protein